MWGFARASLPKIHLATALALVATAAVLAWANLQVSRFAEDFNNDVPPDVDPVTQYFFYRGWPLSPCWFCMIRSMRFRADGFPLFLVLVFDLAAAQLVLYAVARLCSGIIERLRRRRARGKSSEILFLPTVDEVAPGREAGPGDAAGPSAAGWDGPTG